MTFAGSYVPGRSLAAMERRENLKIVSFVQQRRNRHVLATASVPIEKDR